MTVAADDASDRETRQMRINARLDKEMARKFKLLLELTNQGQTEVVKRAIDSYFRELSAGATQP